MSNLEGEMYILGGVSERDIQEGIHQAENGQLICIDALKVELQEQIDIEVNLMLLDLKIRFQELKELHDSWDIYVLNVINKVKQNV